MKNYFTALLLLSLLAVCTSCEMLESIVPKPDSQNSTDSTAWDWCRVYSEVGADTITKGSYLGFTIGQKSSSSYKVLQNLWQLKKITALVPLSFVTPDLGQFEETLPLYNMLALRQGEYPSPAVFFYLEKGKVTRIGQYDTSSLTQWPASEPAALTIRVGDRAETIYPKLLELKDKPEYASYFNSSILYQDDITLGYDPAMASLTEWNFRTPTGNRKEDDIYLRFEQGTLSTIIVRYVTY